MVSRFRVTGHPLTVSYTHTHVEHLILRSSRSLGAENDANFEDAQVGKYKFSRQKVSFLTPSKSQSSWDFSNLKSAVLRNALGKKISPPLSRCLVVLFGIAGPFVQLYLDLRENGYILNL
jgi:hypothetical protein